VAETNAVGQKARELLALLEEEIESLTGDLGATREELADLVEAAGSSLQLLLGHERRRARSYVAGEAREAVLADALMEASWKLHQAGHSVCCRKMSPLSPKPLNVDQETRPGRPSHGKPTPRGQIQSPAIETAASPLTPTMLVASSLRAREERLAARERTQQALDESRRVQARAERAGSGCGSAATGVSALFAPEALR